MSNIVVVPKKEGKIRVCVDFRDLNRASPKDNFLLPHIDMLVDNAARSSTYSFIDGFSGYNQIKMAQEDKVKTTFVTPWGTFCYKVMPFGLKNARATYHYCRIRNRGIIRIVFLRFQSWIQTHHSLSYDWVTEYIYIYIAQTIHEGLV